MNVLFIAVDDLNNRIGCSGDPVVKLPHIGRFARQGVWYQQFTAGAGSDQYPKSNIRHPSL